MNGGATSGLPLLYEQSRQLTNHVVRTDVPQLERTLDQIDADSKRLFKRTTRVAEMGAASGAGGAQAVGLDTRAIYLLANKGFDHEKVRQTLDQIDLTQSLEPLTAVGDTDIEGYLKNEYQNIVTGAILDTKRGTGKAFEDSFERLLYRDWERVRKKVFQELGQHHTSWANKDQSGAFRSSQPNRDRLSGQSMPSAASLGNALKNYMNNPRFAAYANALKDLNEKRRKGQDMESIIAFWDAARRVCTNEPLQVQGVKFWGLLYRMLGQDPRHVRDPKRPMLKARQFAKLYNDTSDSQEAIAFRQQLAQGSRTFLEDEYLGFLKGLLRKERVPLGGTPTIHDEVRAFLRQRLLGNSTHWAAPLQIVEGHPFWAHIYTLVRCGLVRDANDFIERNTAFLQSASPDFPVYFKAWMRDPSRRLSPDMRNRLLKEWNSKMRDKAAVAQVDPYKMVLYKLLGRCDMQNKSVSQLRALESTEDYVWLLLGLSQERALESDPTQDHYTLRDVALQLTKSGSGHYKNITSWIQVLMLVGEFEYVVAEMIGHDGFSVDAIFFALTMAHYGVLRVPPNPTDVYGGKFLIPGDTLQRPGGAYQLRLFNLPHIVNQCVHNLAPGNPLGALQFVLWLGFLGLPLSQEDAKRLAGGGDSSISQSSGRKYTSYAHKLIRDIVLTSGEFEALVGETHPNGTRTPGEAERYQNLVHIYSTEDFRNFVTIPAADSAEREGRYQEAILLLNLAGEHGRVVDLLNRQLSDRLLEQRYRDDARASGSQDASLHQSGRADVFPKESDPAELAQQVLQYYQAHPFMANKIDPDARQTCELLLALTRFMRACTRGATANEALPHLLNTSLVPTRTDMQEIQQCANQFKHLNDLVTKVMPDVLVAASTLVFESYQSVTRQRVGNHEASHRDRQLTELKDLAKALTLFAGSLQYRIPGDTLTAMNKMLVLMC
ncbi:Nup93/Nic96-domain-containing protein [Fimicolochytrium jonesii]|uniref:Nup93/Nic96-domain-containing protein n=1 Tax=Fimicolochytrium jonesii TaxID=1396493 RepID=UPI0022FF22E5|nr:Nup93/Nic96-domain-containing protein [Fimicolochytrium jonesii]KAI8822571.1 Nup93/Nic96-domain-containing protein [Fimicolochytrium jonesii]